jgi:hypothetical protein
MAALTGTPGKLCYSVVIQTTRQQLSLMISCKLLLSMVYHLGCEEIKEGKMSMWPSICSVILSEAQTEVLSSLAKVSTIKELNAYGWMYLFAAYTYHCLFNFLENEGYLDVENHYHLFCLHYVFKPRITECLEQFKSGWDNHPIESAGCQTPNQLWISGLYSVANSNGRVSREVWDFCPEVNDSSASYIVVELFSTLMLL